MKQWDAWNKLPGSLVLLLLMLFLMPSVASAQDIRAEPPPLHVSGTPVHGMLELRFGSYKPSIDKEFAGTDGPYDSMFGGPGLLFEGAGQGYVYQGIGKVGVGGSVGVFNKRGHAFTVDNERSADRIKLTVVPLRAFVMYQFDYLQEEFRIPLVLSVRAGLDYAFWKAKTAGKVSDGIGADDSHRVARGGTFGWHYGVRLAFWLNWLAPGMSAGFDGTYGVNNTYLFAEFLSSHLNDFGSKKSWDLSDNLFVFGIAFEF